jgi:hypothetical protein
MSCSSAVQSKCSGTVREVFDALFRLVEEKSVDGYSIRLAELRTIIECVARPAGPFETFYSHREKNCLGAAKAVELDRRRTNALVRILLQPVEGLFEDPAVDIPRALLPQLVNALHLMLGAELSEQLQSRAAALAASHRRPHQATDWQAVFDSDEGRVIAQEALVSIAGRFRRFDARKDWVMLLLNTNPAARAVTSSAFVVRDPEERFRQRPVSDTQFSALIQALFSRVHPSKFDEAAESEFLRRFGQSPDAVFGPLFVELARLRKRERS